MNSIVKIGEIDQAIAKAVAEGDLAVLKECRDRLKTGCDYLRIKAKERRDLLPKLYEYARRKLVVERHMGAYLKTVRLHKGGRPSGRNGNGKTDASMASVSLASFGIDPHESSRWQLEAVVPKPKFDGYCDEREQIEKEITQAGLVEIGTGIVRERRARSRARKRQADVQAIAESNPGGPLEALAAADLRFKTIVIDPPWDWSDEGDCDQKGRARPDYATMPIGEIAVLPVAKLADDDAHLYLWITNRSLPKGFGLLDAWGFRYVTCLTWCKPSIGMGNYFRGSTEHVLFGVRGSLALLRKNAGTWFAAKRARGHGAKPAKFYDLIESCSPGPRLEMFGRGERKGWTVWGAPCE